MPSKDENGKRKSGAQLRKEKAVREAPDRAPAAPPKPVRRAAAAPAPAAKATASADDELPADYAENPFERLRAPPIEDTAQLVRWGAQVHALATYAIANNPKWYPNMREWVRALTGATTQLGVIRDKAAEQQKIDQALNNDAKKGKQAGLADVRGRKATPVSRPG